MTTVLAEPVVAPSGGPAARAALLSEARAAADLAGRTVWCAGSPPLALAAATALRRAVAPAVADGVTADALPVRAPDHVVALAERLDELLHGLDEPELDELGGAAHAAYDEALDDAEGLARGRVAPGDVVVLHDTLSALVAQAMRERGAHVVWHVPLATARGRAGEAFAFLNAPAGAVDAYAVAWPAQRRGEPVERIAMLMPSAGLVAERDALGTGTGPIGWRAVLAEVVRRDRAEHVGGRLHARPAVTAR